MSDNTRNVKTYTSSNANLIVVAVAVDRLDASDQSKDELFDIGRALVKTGLEGLDAVEVITRVFAIARRG